LNQEKTHIDNKAVFWTAITISVFVGLLFFLGFKTVQAKEESAMLINFGNTESGSGNIEPARTSPAVKTTPPVKATPAPPTPVEPEASANAPEDVETQDFEEAAAIEAAKKKAEEERQKEIERQRIEKERQRQDELKRLEQERIEQERIEQERLEQERLEQERLEQERLEQERLEKERLEREAKAEAIRQQTSNAFGKANSTATSQGNTSGSGNEGAENGGLNTQGVGLGVGTDFSLDGRSVVGSLPLPELNIQEECIVVVNITVDASGKVISAVPGGKGSTTLKSEFLNAAKAAALNAQFTSSDKVKQTGSITYNFRFKK